MVATLITTALICAGSLLVGQAVCRLAGYERFTWIAPAVGFSVLMLLASTALHLPGRSATTAVLCLLLALAGAALLLRDGRARPSLGGVLLGLPALLAALIPFAANGRFGVLGWSFDNDMASHLLWADAYRSQAIAAINPLPPGYPLGPHALVASVAQGLGIGVDDAFTGLQISVLVLIAWTSLAVLGRLAWWGRAVVATLTATTYMLASYYGEGAFKETIEALLVLAFALGLRELLAARRWAPLSFIPLALILAGSVANYSYTGLIWPAATLALLLALWGASAALSWRATRRRLREFLAGGPRRLLPLALAAVVGVVVLIPELPRLVHFFEQTNTGGVFNAIPKNDLGNLPHKLSPWQVFGIWLSPDFRFVTLNQLHQGLWTAVAVAAVLVGLVWWVARRDLVLPAAVVASFVVYAIADRSQSPYVVAKALVIISPLLVLLAGRALLDRDTPPLPRGEMRLFSLGLAALLVFGLGKSSYEALRFAVVGSKAHQHELATFRPLVNGKRVLNLGYDDFVYWELNDARIEQPKGGTGPTRVPSLSALVKLRPEKASQLGYSFDFDSLDPASYEEFEYVIAPRDGRLSSPPSNLVLIARTRDYNLFHRVGPTPRRRILNEGYNPGAVLDCHTPAGRHIASERGIAAVRESPILLALPALAPGSRFSFSESLPAGRWQLTIPYVSPQPLTLSALGHSFHLPATLDRLDNPGTGWPAGEIVLAKAAPVSFTISVDSAPILGLNQPVYLTELAATRAESDRLIALRQACGAYVDWYLPSK
ncbi:MAG TPA: hypothetical protein VNZ05_04830 [Solirubrobacteraceae bacterium]|nr:hypothetical protein [Solirubrobacteraceae bacterium]